MKSKKPEPERDFGLGLAIAQDYLQQVERSFALVVQDAQTFGMVSGTGLPKLDYFTRNLARLPLFASSLIFCAELYLKWILAATGGKVPETHDLAIIFGRFSPASAAVLETEYESQFALLELKFSLHMLISKEPTPNRDWENRKTSNDGPVERSDDSRLSRVLQDTSNSYTFWRYAAEALSSERPEKEITFHHCYLVALCRACDKIAKDAWKHHTSI